MSALLIFDFDGTLCDSFDAFCVSLNRICQRFGFDPLEEHRKAYFRGLTAQEIVKTLGISSFQIPFFMRALRHELGTQLDELKPFAQLATTLENLRQQNPDLRLGVLSSNSRDTIEVFLEREKLRFDFVATGISLFGKARMLRKVIERQAPEALAKNRIFYIGDETRDIEAARAVGIVAVSVSWGYNQREVLQRHAPDHLLDRVEDLLTLPK